MIERSAYIEGDFRYELRRVWDPGLFGCGDSTVAWIMLNPSTADGEEDDATIRKITGYSKRWGYSGLVVVNLFAYRATKPLDLIRQSYRGDVIGRRNDEFIRSAVAEADEVICGWGNNADKVHGGDERVSHVAWLIGGATAVLPKALKVTKVGQPQHPLYLRGDSERRIWLPVRKKVANG